MLIKALSPLAAGFGPAPRRCHCPAFAAAFSISAALGLIGGDGITALPTAGATAGIVVAFGVLCGRHYRCYTPCGGETEASSLLDFRRSETKYVLILMMIVIGGLDTFAIGLIRPAHVGSAAVMVTALNYGCTAGAFMGSVAGLGLVFATSALPHGRGLLSNWTRGGHLRGGCRGSRCCSALWQGRLSVSFLTRRSGVFVASCIYLSTGARRI